MTEKKLTEAEILNALECCIKSDHFGECFENGCPMISEEGCKVGEETLYPYLLDLITDKNDSIEMYRRNIALLDEQILAKDKEIEELQHEKNELQHEIVSCKAEAIKEFIGAVKFHTRDDRALYGKNAIHRKLDQIAKEMGVEL